MADEILVATVTAAEQQPGARAPALLLALDLGTYGTEQAVMAGHDAAAVVGTQILCRRDADGVVVLSARSHAKGDVALRPETDVEPGTLVS